MEQTAEALFGMPNLSTLEPFRFEPRACGDGNRTEQAPAELGRLEEGPAVADADSASTGQASAADECSRIGHTRWCSCENCQPMAREVDCFCCHECPAAKSFMYETPGMRCVTQHADFSAVCLHPSVLKVAMIAYSEFRGRTDPFSNR